jgi:hypothetical protein
MQIFKRLAIASLFLTATAFSGCNSDETVQIDPAAPTPLKTTLERISESGHPLGSGSEELRARIEELKATDPAKAEELSRDLSQLEGMTAPAQIKAKAREMAAKL